MTLEKVEWLLGRQGEELTAECVPILQRTGMAVRGERFYRWCANPGGRWAGDYFLVSIEGDVVKETFYWEVPLS